MVAETHGDIAGIMALLFSEVFFNPYIMPQYNPTRGRPLNTDTLVEPDFIQVYIFKGFGVKIPNSRPKLQILQGNITFTPVHKRAIPSSYTQEVVIPIMRENH